MFVDLHRFRAVKNATKGDKKRAKVNPGIDGIDLFRLCREAAPPSNCPVIGWMEWRSGEGAIGILKTAPFPFINYLPTLKMFDMFKWRDLNPECRLSCSRIAYIEVYIHT